MDPAAVAHAITEYRAAAFALRSLAAVRRPTLRHPERLAAAEAEMRGIEGALMEAGHHHLVGHLVDEHELTDQLTMARRAGKATGDLDVRLRETRARIRLVVPPVRA